MEGTSKVLTAFSAPSALLHLKICDFTIISIAAGSDATNRGVSLCTEELMNWKWYKHTVPRSSYKTKAV